MGRRSPLNTSSRASSLTPSFKSSIRFSTLIGGFLLLKYELIQLTKVFRWIRSCSSKEEKVNHTKHLFHDFQEETLFRKAHANTTASLISSLIFASKMLSFYFKITDVSNYSIVNLRPLHQIWVLANICGFQLQIVAVSLPLSLIEMLPGSPRAAIRPTHPQ